MAFVISKQSEIYGKKRNIYYLVENYREGTKIKRRKLLTLKECKNLTEFMELLDQQETSLVARLNERKKQVEEFIKTGKNPYFSLPTDTPKLMGERLIKSLERAKADLDACRSKKEEAKRYLEASNINIL